MQYTGEIQTAFCGSVGELKELPGVVSAWLSAQDGEYRTTDVDEEMETFCSLLRKSLEEQMENPTDPSAVVAFECDSELALVILDCINGIAKAKPALKIAVAAKIHFSVSDAVGYYSYYSASGEDTICAARTGSGVDGLERLLENGAETQLEILLQYQKADGTFGQLNLWDIENVLDIPIGSNGLSGCSEEDAAERFEAGLLFLLRRDAEGVLTYLEPDPEMEERFEEIQWEECEDELSEVFQMLTLSNSEKKPNWHGSNQELAEALQEIYPDVGMDFLVKKRKGILSVLDEEGNRYYPGGLCRVGEVQTKIAWDFPPEADWIPFMTSGALAEEEHRTCEKKRFLPTKFDSRFAGKTFVITGEPDGYGREGAEDLIQRFGGVVRGAVSGKTDYLIVGKESGKRKLEKARELGTTILNTDEFEAMISPKE